MGTICLNDVPWGWNYSTTPQGLEGELLGTQSFALCNGSSHLTSLLSKYLAIRGESSQIRTGITKGKFVVLGIYILFLWRLPLIGLTLHQTRKHDYCNGKQENLLINQLPSGH